MVSLRRTRCAALGIALVLGLQGAPARAQGGPADLGGTASGSAAKLEEIEAQIERARARTAEWNAKAAEYEKARNNAPARLAELDAEIAQLRNRDTATPPSDLSPGRIDALLLSAEQELALAQREASEVQDELDRRAERRRQLPGLLAEARARLEEPKPEAPVAGDDAALLAARERLAEQSRLASEAELRSHEQELSSYEARGQLLEKLVERANLRLAAAQQRIDALRRAQSERWMRETERETEQALRAIENARSLTPDAQNAVRQMAEENAQLARSRSGEGGLLAAIDDVSQKLRRADARVNEIQADLERLTRKIESAGPIDSVGLLLRSTRSQAPDVGMYRRFIRLRQAEISAVQERQVELREQLDALAHVDEVVAQALQRFESVSAEDRGRLESVLRDLLETKRKHLTALLSDYEVYFQKLVDFDARQQELIAKTEKLLRFIDQQVLWIPSGGALRPRLLRNALEAAGWLALPRHWLRLGQACAADLRRAPLLNLGFALLAAVGLVLVRRIRPRLRELAARARPSISVDATPTLEALGLTLLLVPWGPLAMAYIGWRLSVSPEANQFVRSFAHGLSAAGMLWLSLELPRQILRHDGLADAHFGWPEQAVARLRRLVGRIVALIVPLVLVIQLFEMRGDEAARESLGRITFIALSIALAAVTHLLVRDGGPLRAILASRQEIIRIRPWQWRVLHAGGVAAPLALGAVAARGYYWTALQLGSSYHLTLVFLFLVLVLFELSLRLTLLARRRLAFGKLEAAREAARAAREAAPSSGEAAVVAEPELDMATVDAHTSQLLSASAVVLVLLGLWFLWSDLVPALAVTERIELWTSTETVTIETAAADGSREFHSEERPLPVTLADLLRALLYVFMTAVLVRNLPGLLEISVFRRFDTAAGERYAYATIGKYVVTLLGGLLVVTSIGLNWSNVQWLVAAVGLGLGFGLQEIFANFISGLIILLERPMRVGDTVTVGDISGTVSKIRVRATWITAFDRKELVVPNKEFVTNRLINWSLSDSVLRVDVAVGIGEGSDTELAMRTLLAVAEANELVLREPKPAVFFLGFGDGSLNFELRAYSPDVDHRLLIHHQLHLAVNDAFREAGIELANPQRDLHLRSVPPGWEKRPAEEPAEPDEKPKAKR